MARSPKKKAAEQETNNSSIPARVFAGSYLLERSEQWHTGQKIHPYTVHYRYPYANEEYKINGNEMVLQNKEGYIVAVQKTHERWFNKGTFLNSILVLGYDMHSALSRTKFSSLPPHESRLVSPIRSDREKSELEEAIRQTGFKGSIDFLSRTSETSLLLDHYVFSLRGLATAAAFAGAVYLAPYFIEEVIKPTKSAIYSIGGVAKEIASGIGDSVSMTWNDLKSWNDKLQKENAKYQKEAERQAKIDHQKQKEAELKALDEEEERIKDPEGYEKRKMLEDLERRRKDIEERYKE